jgi:hypothetical protein
MQRDAPQAGDESKKYGRIPLPPKAVSPRWRFAAVVLVVLLVVVAILPFVLTSQTTSVETSVQWHQYSIPGGPGSQNETSVAPGTFCPSSNPVGPVLLAVNWSTSHDVPLVHVRVWTVLPLESPPYWGVDLLFQSSSGTSGSGTFNALPACGQVWTVDDNATAATTVTVTMVLVYKYNSTSTTHLFP